ncbi:hypothetical protein GF345_02105 [Candidatus Woesearchaeota archaeon]|nr:hypothetical protein [Candidatus Woesearchaeota archaeon]
MKLKKPDSIFGIKASTKGQKRFMKYFIIIKSVIFVIIFALAVVFLWKLRSFDK